MKRADLAVSMVFIILIFGLTAADLVARPVEVSVTERRKLAQRPILSLESVVSGRFTEDYAHFMRDQIVFRDDWRAVKAFIELKVLAKSENNGVYVVDGNLYDKFYGINQRYIERDAALINDLLAAIDSDKTFLSIIPSKAHMLDADRYLLSDQDIIASYLNEHVNTATYIDLMELFQGSGPESYYRTDHHWTTEGAMQAYEALALAMGYSPIEDYTLERVTDAYAGSNYGKVALPSIAKDSIYLAHNAYLDQMSVCRYESADTCEHFDSVYFLDQVRELDPYDVFLGGAGPIIVIENDRAEEQTELVVFKDSYAHALTPFLAQHFRKVTLVDLRYVRKELILEDFDLTGKTVLFLFSTTVLNTDPQILN